ncbi:MAG: T9SS type A sorting domain-containing protein, partial [Flavobacteriales bacterium]|nr:T9SS type A sorting domain-containing protein [Flavobacteriales bacterium]
AEEVDDTKIQLQFVEDTENVRPIQVGWLMGSWDMIDGPLQIPANTVQTFHQEVTPFWSDKSLISICPHMHLIGTKYQVWMETPEGDSIPLIDIPEWNFHWQFYYTFQQIQKMPAGSTLKSIGVYDNTVNNELNPNNPPQDVWNGALTTDEMFLCYFIYSNYQEGDEDIVLDPSLSIPQLFDKAERFEVYPNPVETQLQWGPLTDQQVHYSVQASTGEIVDNWSSSNGINYRNVASLSPGQYILTARSGGKTWLAPFIKR